MPSSGQRGRPYPNSAGQRPLPGPADQRAIASLQRVRRDTRTDHSIVLHGLRVSAPHLPQVVPLPTVARDGVYAVPGNRPCYA